jgi:hypothetical protein
VGHSRHPTIYTNLRINILTFRANVCIIYNILEYRIQNTVVSSKNGIMDFISFVCLVFSFELELKT